MPEQHRMHDAEYRSKKACVLKRYSFGNAQHSDSNKKLLPKQLLQERRALFAANRN
jgi:hypothetical protein